MTGAGERQPETDRAASRPLDRLTPDEQAAWRGMLRMHAALAASLNRQLSADSGLSLQDFAVLALLSEQADGRMRPFELGRTLGWEKSRLSHHLSRMAERGTVRREHCPADQRGSLIAITPAGRAAVRSAVAGHVAAVRRAFLDRLSPDQLRTQAAVAAAVLEGLAGECDGVEGGG